MLALLDRLLAQVRAIDFDQVERTERCGVTATVIADELENGKALAVADDGLSKRSNTHFVTHAEILMGASRRRRSCGYYVRKKLSSRAGHALPERLRDCRIVIERS